MRYFLTYILSSILFLTLCSAQKKFTFNQGSISTDQFYEVLPFEYLMDKIIIEAEVNGVRGRYIVDTGAMCIVFKDTANNHNYNVIRRINIEDANDRKKETEIVQVNKIRIGELEYYNIPALYIEPFVGLLKCFDVDGMIGSNLLRFGAFKIDVKNEKLYLADSYKDFNLQKKQGGKLYVNKVQSSPFISLKMNGKKQNGVLIDTGSGGIYSFNENVAKQMQQKGLFNQPAYESNGTNSQGAWGLDSTDIQTQLWRVNNLQVANADFTNLLLRSDHASSRIGMELLENGELVVDYPKKRFFFKPYKSVTEGLSVAGFGIDFASINDSIRVNGLWSGTIAEQQGISKGDVLVDIKGFDLRDADLCQKFFLLKDLAFNKNELDFIFRRKGSDDEYSVVLQRLK
ncbi:aspartyl protease family protein [Carboxylicivirga linearis]|uniref:Aspartyl protease family protein n=1 Tax=Carboxylicivirga linearis TaxID=1628157 RepID=A0ABS5JRH8_9BACT|nr:aspartyl protease family protein [Carboxylicivirga linearis]MBS2097503.1 aspartyl protease family protein [Carboxylicivirga linearis]